MKKRTICFILTITLLSFLITGCQNSQSNTASDTSTPSTQISDNEITSEQIVEDSNTSENTAADDNTSNDDSSKDDGNRQCYGGLRKESRR